MNEPHTPTPPAETAVERPGGGSEGQRVGEGGTEALRAVEAPTEMPVRVTDEIIRAASFRLLMRPGVDFEMVQEMCVMLLESQGYTVVEPATPQAAS